MQNVEFYYRLRVEINGKEKFEPVIRNVNPLLAYALIIVRFEHFFGNFDGDYLAPLVTNVYRSSVGGYVFSYDVLRADRRGSQFH